jgi:general secretion pathway protein A
MFLDYYRLHEQPFGVTPDPRYTFFTSTHREALASLAYALEIGSGFAVLVAKPGMGKTTLLFRLLDYLQDKARTVFVFHTQCNSVDLMRYILADMKIKYSGKDLVEMHALLNDALLSEARLGRSVVVAIDESQNLSHDVLETIRLLSDFETPRRKLLQIILCGQPQLGSELAHPDLVQLRQRITVLCKLTPLSLQEVNGYIEHRLRVAGHAGTHLFTPEAVQLIYAESRGIPRVINTLCSGALSIGCALGRSRIGAEVVQEVLADLSVDALIEEMASAQPSPDLPAVILSADPPEPAGPSKTLVPHTPATQTLTALLATPITTPVLEKEPGDSVPLAVDDSISARAMALAQKIEARFEASATVAATPAPIEIAPPVTEAVAPGAADAEPRAVTAIAAAAKQFRPPAQKTAPKNARDARIGREILRGKSGWLAGVILLSTIFLGFALRFHATGTKANFAPSIVPAANAAIAPATETEIAAPVPAAAAAPAASKRKKARPAGEPNAEATSSDANDLVHVVQTNETLSGISYNYLGYYGPTVLQEVQKDNTDLKNPDFIRAGQKVLVPLRIADPNKINPPQKDAGESIEGKP